MMSPKPSLEHDVSRLAATLHPQSSIVMLTGAGLSSGSGIPTYRDHTGKWLRVQPITHQEFVADHARRQRYWGRSMIGWPGVRDARPNGAHRAIAQLESAGVASLCITQNVDRLHQRAGSRRVIDLHGRLDQVVCLDCGDVTSRELMQGRLERDNPGLLGKAGLARPDGDADLPDTLVARVRVPGCERCDGTLMPDVVFFGGSVPKSRVEEGFAAIESADALWVVGSSLQVFSGFRFCRHAVQHGVPVVIINPGMTRADGMASERFHADAGALLPQLVEALKIIQDDEVIEART